jgi:hypothetical protein
MDSAGRSMMHYHGTPITPRSKLYELAGRNFCVSYSDPRDVEVCHQIGQSVMLDNGAFSAWTQGRAVDWQEWYDWVQPWLEYRTTWAVLPDSIDGDEHTNDHLASEWAWMLSGLGQVVPVWHLHENISRLSRLVDQFGRVCFGSSGDYRDVGTDKWHRRVAKAFDTLSDDFGRVPWVHMLRGMSLSGGIYPFASVDSTDVARNHKRQHNNARAMADRWDSLNCRARWHYTGTQTVLEEYTA